MTHKLILASLGALALTAGSAMAQGGAMPRDANGDGTVTRAEMSAKLAQQFARMDANSDGKLDAADRTAKRGDRFKKIDGDGNGEISLTEMQTAQSARTAKRFARLDTDNNNSVSAAEMEAVKRKAGNRGKRGGKHGHGMMRMMKTADTDANGSISQAEFTAFGMQRFDRMDANGDGQVTAAERKAARAARGAKSSG